MKTLINLLIAATLAMALPAFADAEASAQTLLQAAARNQPALQACPAPDRVLNLSEVSQTDCCKGHKGVCGCRAGKIVCCDNTVSPNCTCHADSGIEN